MTDDANQTVVTGLDNRGVRRITLNRPDKRNAFDAAVIGALTAAFHEADQDPATRVVLLDAAGKHFSAGADLEWMRSTATLSESANQEDARRLAELMQTLDALSKPVIVSIQGAAFGGALGLICCSDIAIAASDARFCLSEVRLGLLPATISPFVVRAMGHRQARRYMLTAEVMDAEAARNLGLIHELVSPEEQAAVVAGCIDHLLQGGPEAQKQCKKLLRDLDNPALAPSIHEHTAQLIAQARTGEEGQEGLSAFFDHRNPAWQPESSS